LESRHAFVKAFLTRFLRDVARRQKNTPPERAGSGRPLTR
jgi:hypothetical protein